MSSTEDGSGRNRSTGPSYLQASDLLLSRRVTFSPLLSRLLPAMAMALIVLTGPTARAAGEDSAIVEDAYRAAVAAWAAGSFDEGNRDLEDLEARFDDQRDQPCVDWAESHTVEELSAADPEALLPVLAVHVNLWRLHTRSHGFRLAFMTRERLERWLDLYAGRAGPGAGARAADLLVFWAKSMLASGFPQDTGEVLDLALSYVPELPEALYLRVLVAERSWDYEQALPFLEKLMALDPSDPHARLRYGVNLGRCGRIADAARELAAVARSGGEPWERILAYEELARELDEARGVRASSSSPRPSTLRAGASSRSGAPGRCLRPSRGSWPSCASSTPSATTRSRDREAGSGGRSRSRSAGAA